MIVRVKKAAALTAVFFLAAACIFPERSPFFNGGMLYHGGYGAVAYGSGITGYANGLGGRLALAVLPNLRIGGAGFATGFAYASAGVTESSFGIGFGGLTAEAFFDIRPVRISVGVLAGGGAVRLLHVESVNGDGTRTVRMEHTASIIAMPYLIGEIPLGEVISLAFMADWVFGSRIAGGYSYGGRLHIGLLFNR